jgi:hypothetical protein
VVACTVKINDVQSTKKKAPVVSVS